MRLENLGLNMAGKFVFEIASQPEAITECQRLRYQVFALEMGASLESAAEQIDADPYDPFCRHLIVREASSGMVVACTRALSDEDARQAGGFYTQTEFRLGGLRDLPGRKLEIGRTCVHPEHRDGSAITCLWLGLSEFMLSQHYDYLFGCASVDMSDGGRQAHAIYRNAQERELVNLDLGVQPRIPLPQPNQPSEIKAVIDLSESVRAILPPLLKAYLNLGAEICGEPCWDRQFNVADMLILVRRERIAPRYVRRFLKNAPSARSHLPQNR